MLKTKLFSVLKSMDKIEIKSFESFSLSPYHNSNKTISRFLKYVEKYFHILKGDTPIKKFDNQLIFQKVYKGANFNEGTFAVLRSQTLSLLEEFFTYERFRREKKLRQEFLAESYNEKKLTRAYKNNYLEYERMNLEEKERDPCWAMRRIDIFMTKMSWHDYDKGTEGYSLLLEVLEDLDIFYLNQKMRTEAIKANINKRKQMPIDSRSFKQTIDEQLVKYETKSKGLGFHVRLRELLYGKDRSMLTIEKFRQDFEEGINDLNHLDKEIIYFDFQNIVIREYKQRGKQIAPILFDTYLTGIENKIINISEGIKYTTFYNIVSAGSGAKRFKDVEDFINKFSDKINPKDQASTLTLTQAQILHDKREKGNWQKIIDLTADFNHSDIDYKCYFRSLRARAFFMIFQEDASYYYTSLAQIKAFKAYLFREKNSLNKLGKDNQRLAFWLQKLLVAFNKKRQKKDILQIFNKIETDVKLTIFHKEWLLELKKDR